MIEDVLKDIRAFNGWANIYLHPTHYTMYYNMDGVFKELKVPIEDSLLVALMSLKGSMEATQKEIEAKKGNKK